MTGAGGGSAASAGDLAAVVTRTNGVPAELLDGYVGTLAEVIETGRPVREDERRRWWDIGAGAAASGVPMRGLVDLYLSATMRAWPELPGVRAAVPGDRVPALGEAVLRTADDAVMTLTAAYEEVQREAARRSEFVADLLGGQAAGNLAERAERCGLRLAGTLGVAAAMIEEPSVAGGEVAREVESDLVTRFGSREVLVCTNGGLLVCLAAERVEEVLDEFVRRLETVLSGRGAWRVGIGAPWSGPAGAACSFREARDVLTIGACLELPRRVLRARDVLVYRVLGRDSAALSELVVEVLAPLRGSRRGGVPLLATLSAYFRSGGVATAAAQRLRVGVRTVTYRLRRVEELTGYSLDEPDQAFTLQAAVLGARLIGWPDREGAG